MASLVCFVEVRLISGPQCQNGTIGRWLVDSLSGKPTVEAPGEPAGGWENGDIGDVAEQLLERREWGNAEQGRDI